MRPTAADITLGDFLRTRRGALAPQEVDVPSYGRRRVPGLRREEVAFLAGVSTSYYTRIEQGTAGAVSAEVLRSIAEALRLGPDDRAQLTRLARATASVGDCRPQQAVLPSLAALMPHIAHLPAGVLSRSMQMLAWTPCGHRVVAPHREYDEPASAVGLNWAEVLLLDPECRSLFVDWRAVAEDLVGRLRVSAARHPSDAGIADLVASLTAANPVFADLWMRHPTRERPLGSVLIDHPELGRLEFRDTVLHSAEDEDQSLVVFHCEPRSATAAALRRLRSS